MELEEGDIVELIDGDIIEAKVPKHLEAQAIIRRGGTVEPSPIGDFSLEFNEILIGGAFHYFAGRYIIVRIEHIPASGNSYAGGPAYDRIFCEHVSNKHFGMVRLLSDNVKKVGRAIKKWEIEEK